MSRVIMVEKKYDTKVLLEVKFFCEYLLDDRVKEVQTYNRQVADCFSALGFDITEIGNQCWSISRKIIEKEDIGFDF